MSRLRISDPQSILNVMRDAGPSSGRVRQLEIRVSPEDGRSHPLEAELHGSPDEGGRDAAPADVELAPDEGVAEDVAEPAPGPRPG